MMKLKRLPSSWMKTEALLSRTNKSANCQKRPDAFQERNKSVTMSRIIDRSEFGKGSRDDPLPIMRDIGIAWRYWNDVKYRLSSGKHVACGPVQWCKSNSS